jgi:hypothetical protein
MADVRFTGVKMMSLPCAAEIIYEGKLYKDDGSGRMTVCNGVTDTVLVVAAYSSIDVQLGSAVAKVVGDNHPFFLIGSGAIVLVPCDGSITMQFGDKVYVGQTNNGYANTSTTSTPKAVGHYVGKDNKAYTDGVMMEVVLDCPIGST